MSHPFLSLIYENKHYVVSWSALECIDNTQFSQFLHTKVYCQLNDAEGNDIIQNQLKGLALTGLGQENLSLFLQAERPEERAWAASEALGLAFLEERDKVVFPWNMERDKRTPFASLPGADIVGFVGEDANCRFVFGEIKSSSEEKYPPQVMAGRSYAPDEKTHTGMGYQILKLAHDLSTMNQLIRWLLLRVKNTKYEQHFIHAAEAFLNSGNKAICLYGVLIRDTKVHEKDLSALGEACRKVISYPTTCELVALYLPWSIAKLNSKIKNGGAS